MNTDLKNPDNNPIQRAMAKFLAALPGKTFSTRICEEAVVSALGTPLRYDDAGGYSSFANAITHLVTTGAIVPVKSRGTNGKRPPLHCFYRISIANPASQLSAIRPILNSLHPRMNTAWYQAHPTDGLRDEPLLRAISTYLFSLDNSHPAPGTATLNERSFALCGDEKILASAAGQAVLRRICLTEIDLNCIRTYEPFFYVPISPQGTKVLVCENRDSFFTLQHVLTTASAQPTLPIRHLIYGEGKKIEKSLQFIDNIVNISMNILYYGDIDAEGLGILVRLAESARSTGSRHTILPHEPLYAALLAQCRQGVSTTTRQRLTADERNQLQPMFRDSQLLASLLDLVDNHRRIPQEALGRDRLLLAEVVDIFA